MNGFRKLNEFVNRQLFSAFGEESLVNGLDGEVGRTEGIAERLATLIEARFDHLNEELFITFQGGYVVTREANNGRFDLGRRVEDMLMDSEEIFYIIEC